VRRLALAVSLVLWLAGPALAEEPAKPPQAPPAGMGKGAPPGLEKLPDQVKLTEKDVQGFIAATEKLRKLEEEGKLPPAPDAKTPVEAISSSKQAIEIIDAHGFTPQRFQDVAYSIGMSLAADEIKKTPEELAAARAKQDEQLAAMKDQISPEQYAQLKQQLAMADRMVAEFKKLPAGNVELVRKHAAAIKAAVGQGPAQ
jgi:hypothetical protein